MKICVIGTGYVGLVCSAMFADWGNNVVGVDIDEKKVRKLRGSAIPIYEPGLAELVKKNLEGGRLNFTTKLSVGIKESEVVFICVGTPQEDTGAADLSAVFTVAKDISKHIKSSNHYRVIVLKSTVPVGTNERVKRIIAENSPAGVEFDVVSNPEFLREGSSIEDMENTDRTVIGSDSRKAIEKIRKLYDHLNKPIIECDFRTAELIKYASNAFLATKISFINEMGQLCESADANVDIVADGMGLDRRIGRNFLNVSIGYGGSCFPKDVAALYRTSTDQAYDFKLLRSVMEVNELQKGYFVRKVTRVFGENLTGSTFACLGLAYKGKTDDVRESVSIKVVQMLRGLGANLRVYDPEAMENGKGKLGTDKIYYAKDIYDAAKGASAICILTDWEEFTGIDLKKLKKIMNEDAKVIFDGRNLLDQEEVEGLGFIYFAIGKRTNGYKEDGGVISALLGDE